MNQKNPRKKTKRKLPELSYTVRRFSDYQTITNHPKTKSFLFQNLLPAIRDGIASNLDEVPIVQLKGFNTSVMLPRADWKASLNKAIDFYSSQEKYEVCQRYKELLESI